MHPVRYSEWARFDPFALVSNLPRVSFRVYAELYQSGTLNGQGSHDQDGIDRIRRRIRLRDSPRVVHRRRMPCRHRPPGTAPRPKLRSAPRSCAFDT